MMRFLVTGTPRSATKYSARLFSALGLPCHHEQTLRPLASLADVLAWYDRDDGGESSWMAWTLAGVFPTTVPVFHTIRDPWKVIDSLANRNSILRSDQMRSDTMAALRATVSAYVPGVFDIEGIVDRAATFVVAWNREIESRIDHRCAFYADRLDVATVQRMLGYLDVFRSTECIRDALGTVPTTTNTGYTVNDIPAISDPTVAEWIKQYAEHHGVTRVFCRKVKNVPDRQTPEELAEQMNPDLLEQVNQYAVEHGYQAVEQLVAA